MAEHNSQFDPPWWLGNRHVQSVLGFVVSGEAVSVKWETFELPDGDFVELTWAGSEKGPLVVLLTGLEGSIHSHHTQEMHHLFMQNGWGVVTVHYRGCGRSLNRLARGYHAGDTQDINLVLQDIKKRYPDRALFTLGFSLGANILLNYLAKRNQSPITACVGVSVPFDIIAVSQSCPLLYQWQFVRSLKAKVKQKIMNGLDFPVSIKDLWGIYEMRKYDRLVTAPLFGFKDEIDYYEKSSCLSHLSKVQHPVLILHAKDDPFITSSAIPNRNDLGVNMQLELSEKGGHVGFFSGNSVLNPEVWLGRRIFDYFSSFTV